MIAIEVAGADSRTVSAGDFSTSNFVLDKLVVGRDANDVSDTAGRISVKLVDKHRNNVSNPAMPLEVLYVNTLELKAGATFEAVPDKDNPLYNLYYRNAGEPKLFLMGDVNLDGVADYNDLDVWAAHQSQTGAQWSEGDVNGDRVVDDDDRTIIETAIKIARNPHPARGAAILLDTGQPLELEWDAGLDANSHNVYFGSDYDSVADANQSSPEFKGNQQATMLEAERQWLKVGGTNYWRIDEVDSNDNVTKGYVWWFDYRENRVQNLRTGTWYNWINDAVADANDGDVIVANPGIYYESVSLDKAVTLRSTAPGDSAVVAATIIETNGMGDGVVCGTGYSILSGFTIRNCSTGITCWVPMTIKNNWIHNNNGDGIYIYTYSSDPAAIIRNNTIVNNTNYGISLSRNEGTADPPDIISNCIIWGNGSGSLYSAYGTFDNNVTYSCIQGGYIGESNISDNPGFKNPDDPNDYHLGPNSPCIDAGDPNYTPEPNETDIDGEDRVIDGDANGTVIVDMGADEYYWSGADFNGDGFVNFIDYAQLAVAWQTTPADNDYNDIYDLVDNNSIDYNDLAVFCEDWPWQAGWTKTFPAGTDSSLGAEALYSSSSLSTESLSSEPQPVDIEKLIKWLDEIWLNGELKEIMTEDGYLEFRRSIKEPFE